MLNKFKINNVTIDDVNYSLAYPTTISYSTMYPQIMINNKPIVSVKNYQGHICDDSIEYAKVAINSYKDSGGKYAYLPDEAFDDLKSKKLEDCVGLFSDCTIDEYNILGVYHVVIESKKYDTSWFRFAIYDLDICKSLILYKQSASQFPPTYYSSKHSSLLEEVDMLIRATALLVGDLEDETFNKSLKNIQSLIGQKHGDYAALFFSDYSETWLQMPSSDKVRVLHIYVKNELNLIINNKLLEK